MEISSGIIILLILEMKSGRGKNHLSQGSGGYLI